MTPPTLSSMAPDGVAASARPFFVTGGTLALDAPSYIARAADGELLNALRAGDLCYVLTPRQMGKSSLMARAYVTLRREGAAVCIVDLQRFGVNVTPEQWYNSLLGRLGETFDLEDEIDAFMAKHPHFGPQQSWLEVLQQVVLPACADRRVVIFVDEIDMVRSLPFRANEFFIGLRELYNRRATDATLQRLGVCLLGVATPADLINDQNVTPFNIGRRIELCDFTEEETLALGPGLGHGPEVGETLMRRIYHWTDGQPYLTQRLCQDVCVAGAVTAAEVDRVCYEAFLTRQARDSNPNLTTVRDRLLMAGKNAAETTATLTLYQQVRQPWRRVPYDELNRHVAMLCLSGAVAVGKAGNLRVKNPIYGKVFDGAWIESHLPGREVRRRRNAFLLSCAAVTAACAIITVTFSIQHKEARKAEQKARDAEAMAANKIEEAKKAKWLADDAQKKARIDKARALAAENSAKEAATAVVDAHNQRDKAAAEAQERIFNLIDSVTNMVTGESEGTAPSTLVGGYVAQGGNITDFYKALTGILSTSLDANQPAATDDQKYSEYLRRKRSLGALTARLAAAGGDTGTALDYYGQLVRDLDKLIAKNPAEPQLMRLRLAAVSALHDTDDLYRQMLAARGKPDKEEWAAKLDLAKRRISEGLVAYPNNAEWKLARADNLYLQGDFEPVRFGAETKESQQQQSDAYSEAMSICEKLEADPAQPSAIHFQAAWRLAQGYRKIGNTQQKPWATRESLSKARQNYQQSRKELDSLANIPKQQLRDDGFSEGDLRGTHIKLEYDSALTQHNLGSITRRLAKNTEDKKEECSFWAAEVKAYENLYKDDAQNRRWKNLLVDALNRYGGELLEPNNTDLLNAVGVAKAVELAQRAVEISERHQALALRTLARALDRAGQHDQAAASAREAAKVDAEALRSPGKSNPSAGTREGRRPST